MPFLLYDCPVRRARRRGDGDMSYGMAVGPVGGSAGIGSTYGGGGMPGAAGFPWAMAGEAIAGAISLLDARSRARIGRRLAAEQAATADAGLRAGGESQQAQIAEAALAQMAGANLGRGMGRAPGVVAGAYDAWAQESSVRVRNLLEGDRAAMRARFWGMMTGIEDRKFADTSQIFNALLSPSQDGSMGPGLEAITHLGGKGGGGF